jgi:hypothetical protein
MRRATYVLLPRSYTYEVRQPRRLERLSRALTLGLVVGLVSLAGTAGNSEAPPARSASRALAEAVALVDAAERQEARAQPAVALDNWQRAYQLSSDPTLLLEVARLERQAGNLARASHALERFLAHGSARVSPERLRAATRQLHETAATTARVTLETNVFGTQVDIEPGRGVATPAGFSVSLLLDSGERKLVLSKPGYEARALAINLIPGEVRSVRMHLEKAAGGQSKATSEKPRWSQLDWR